MPRFARHLAEHTASAPGDPEAHKITKVRYVPGARSSDWNTALNALPSAAADWMQIRIGQAACFPTPDDILAVAHGGGANGKTNS